MKYLYLILSIKVVKVELIFVYLSFIVVSLGGREEEEVRFDLSGEDLLSSFVVEVNNQWKSFGRHEQGNCFLS